ncbi:hypothetical protein EMQ_3113 [Acetobacter aceti NBRC 14818]|uniref:Uncharacterized protein n=1 Tax=Acetobacter aceti NBRC 14818 TaxID=887700 RepID=A0AB33IK96_ACEAC|nr:hypothetical protein EMQ_3113 [Acetobacter aceti NBRC 14818]GAN56854.1 hypothetical protein Abac_010_128 [Acetobacter aceti NBRC 14818]
MTNLRFGIVGKGSNDFLEGAIDRHEKGLCMQSGGSVASAQYYVLGRCVSEHWHEKQ